MVYSISIWMQISVIYLKTFDEIFQVLYPSSGSMVFELATSWYPVQHPMNTIQWGTPRKEELLHLDANISYLFEDCCKIFLGLQSVLQLNPWG